ncbi:MAG: hypothetical protein INR65_08600 [Gluconacetobacter diazotrophicus]|nr:hypothetical protein [Gluconacetobacter diazotrophicus]
MADPRLPVKPAGTDPDRLTRRDKAVAVVLALVLIAIVLAIFRLGLAATYGWVI